MPSGDQTRGHSRRRVAVGSVGDSRVGPRDRRDRRVCVCANARRGAGTGRRPHRRPSPPLRATEHAQSSHAPPLGGSDAPPPTLDGLCHHLRDERPHSSGLRAKPSSANLIRFITRRSRPAQILTYLLVRSRKPLQTHTHIAHSVPRTRRARRLCTERTNERTRTRSQTFLTDASPPNSTARWRVAERDTGTEEDAIEDDDRSRRRRRLSSDAQSGRRLSSTTHPSASERPAALDRPHAPLRRGGRARVVAAAAAAVVVVAVVVHRRVRGRGGDFGVCAVVPVAG